jgi:hypothetical protein
MTERPKNVKAERLRLLLDKASRDLAAQHTRNERLSADVAAALDECADLRAKLNETQAEAARQDSAWREYADDLTAQLSAAREAWAVVQHVTECELCCVEVRKIARAALAEAEGGKR